MTKKTFASGLDNLLSSTVPAAKQPQTKPRASVPVPAQPSSAGLVSVLIRLPVDLKIKLDTHCAQNRISKQDFIANLIINTIE